jgi:SAM-dependent methyltransferase
MRPSPSGVPPSMMKDIRSFYDAIAEKTADEWYANNVLMPTIRDFISLLPKNPRVLDLGCGPGYESMRLASTGAEVVGIDISPENIRIARNRCPQCQFAEADFRQLDTRFGIFDGVFASASLIHLTPTELTAASERIAEVLKRAGRFLALVQDGEGLRERELDINGSAWHWGIQLYSKDMLSRLLEPFQFIRDGSLAPELIKQGWCCYLWKVKVHR